MNNDSEMTSKLLRLGEGARVAFAASPYPADETARHVAALLNGQGGLVLVGVNKRGRVTGSFSEDEMRKLRDFLQEYIVPKPFCSVSLDRMNDESVIVVEVPVGTDPPYVFDSTVYVRPGIHTDKASADEIRSMIERRSHTPERWERRLAPGLVLHDLDRRLVDFTVLNAQTKRGRIFRDPRNLDGVFSELSLSSYGQLTNAADVLYGLRVSERQPQTRLRAVCFETDKGGNYIDEQIHEGPALNLLNSGMEFLRRHSSISAEFKDGKLSRDSTSQYPFFSLREGLVNALVHRDYASSSGGININVYPSRVEICNSGHLPEGVSVKDLSKETLVSKLVNPDICHIFYLNELMERVGRGTFKIVQECHSLDMRRPQWRDESTGVRLTIFAARLRIVLPAHLNDRQRSFIQKQKQGKQFRVDEYVAHSSTKISDRQARRDLHHLVEEGFLTRGAKGPATFYVRTSKGLEQG